MTRRAAQSIVFGSDPCERFLRRQIFFSAAWRASGCPIWFWQWRQPWHARKIFRTRAPRFIGRVFARLIERVRLIRQGRRAAVLDAPDFEVRPDGPGRQGINRQPA
jgi:hypothetical protein